MKKILFYLIITILCCNKVYALECNPTDKERLQKLAANISYIVEEYPENGENQFKVIFTGVSKELRLFSEQKFASFYNFTDNAFGETEVPGLYNGKTYTFNIYGRNICVFNTLREITISIPKYNQYYNNPLCENAKEYKLCQKWFDSSEISYNDFTNKVNEYIETRKDNNSDGSHNESLDDQFAFNFDFGKFYKLVYFPSLFITVILIILLVIFWNKENKKNRL